jgi:hydrogenase maturation protease
MGDHMNTKKILVLGIGNLVMSDDGVGVKVVQRLQREYRFEENVELLDGGTLGLDLLPKLEGIDLLIVVDAVETGHAPGTCVRLTGNELPIALETKVSPHQMGLKDLLSVAELLGHCPKEMVLIGVQPGSIEMDTELTPEVEVKIEILITTILTELVKHGIVPLDHGP